MKKYLVLMLLLPIASFAQTEVQAIKKEIQTIRLQLQALEERLNAIENVSPKKIETQSPPPASSGGQCRATTKKKTRCSRTAKSNGYCWQHGG